jgi:hypothetical protein
MTAYMNSPHSRQLALLRGMATRIRVNADRGKIPASSGLCLLLRGVAKNNRYSSAG